MGSPKHRPSFDPRTVIHYTRLTVALGKRQYFALGKDEAEARVRFNELRARLSRGELTPGKNTTATAKDDGTPDVALVELAHRHLEWVEQNLGRTYATRRNYVRQFLRYVDDRHSGLCWVSEITFALLDEYVTWVKRNRARSKVNGGNEHLRHVKTMLRWGWEREMCVIPRRFPAIRHAKTRTGALGTERLMKLLNHPGLPADVRDLVVFAVGTGLRPQEIRPLRREWIAGLDGPNPMVRIEHHKTAELSKTYIPRTIPLDPLAAGIVRRQLAGHPHEDRVFLAGNGRPYRSAQTLRQRLRRWAERAGIGHITTYDLRHTFGTLTARTTNLAVVGQVMGHSGMNTTRRYVSNDEGYHREAMARTAGEVAKLVAEAGAGDEEATGVNP